MISHIDTGLSTETGEIGTRERVDDFLEEDSGCRERVDDLLDIDSCCCLSAAYVVIYSFWIHMTNYCQAFSLKL